MLCHQITHKLDMFVDGECSVDDQELIRAHLESCSTCSDRVDALRRFNREINEQLGAEKAPPGLWERIEARVPETVADPCPPKVRRWSEIPVWPMAIAASFFLLLALPVGVTWWQQHPEESAIFAPIQDYATYRDSGRDLDIASQNPVEVRAWFDSRLPFELPEIKAKVAGFELAGGRLCWFLDRRLGAFTYERGREMISLYVMSDHELTLPEATFEPRLNISLSSHRHENLNNLVWHADGLVYTIVSDLTKSDMSIFLAAMARI